ncbi:mitochondrial import inner membrane translocase subunit Tim17/Tim22/Tim23 family protein [Carex rostrata]
MSNRDLETRVTDQLKALENGQLFDLGHPLLNRIAESFVKAAGIGAIQAVSREAYFTAMDVDGTNTGGEVSKKNKFSGDYCKKTMEVMVKDVGKESLQWGLAAGMYSGLTYGLTEVRGTHDWKNSFLAGAVTGVAVALTSERASHEQIVQAAITGAALSSAAKLLSGIF